MFATRPFRAMSASIAARSLGRPPAAFPGRVATDADLMIAVDRQQTRLALPLNASDTSMTVVDPSSIGANNLLTIDAEIVRVTAAPTGNVVPIIRGFDGTTPEVHLASAVVSGFVDAWHHNALVAEVEAIEQALGPNLSQIPSSPMVFSTQYDFPAQAPGGTLGPGNQVITLTPVPKGVNGTDTNHTLWISGGTGTAEAVPITGGTAVSGAPSGTIIVTCANAHSGAWTIQSATAGIKEAIIDNPATEVHVPAGHYIIHDTIKLDPRVSFILSGEGSSINGSYLDFGTVMDRPAISMSDPAGSVTSNERKILRDLYLQGTGTATGGDGIYLDETVRVTLDNITINNFAQSGVHMHNAFEITISQCQIAQCGNWGIMMDGISILNRVVNSYVTGNSRNNNAGGVLINGTSAGAPTLNLLLDGVDIEASGTVPFSGVTVSQTYGLLANNVAGLAVTNCYFEANVGDDVVIYGSAVTSLIEFNNWFADGHISYGGTVDRVQSWGNVFNGVQAYRALPADLSNYVIGPDTCIGGATECGSHPRSLGIPAAQSVAASANLTLTGTLTDVPGATITLGRAGRYLIAASCDFSAIGDAGQLFIARLMVGGVAQLGDVSYMPGAAAERITSAQQWLVTTSSAGVVAKLQALKAGGSGTSTVNANNTTLSAVFAA